MPKLFKLKQIQYASETTRQVCSLEGMQFYQESKNSPFADTWLPFFCLDENGAFIVPTSPHFPPEIVGHIKTYFLAHSGNIEIDAFLSKLGNLPSLWVSAQLGGGIWKEDFAKGLFRFLIENNPHLFSTLPSLELLPVSGTCDSQGLNTWLMKKNHVKNLRELKEKFPTSLEDLNSHINYLYRQVFSAGMRSDAIYQRKNEKKSVKRAMSVSSAEFTIAQLMLINEYNLKDNPQELLGIQGFSQLEKEKYSYQLKLKKSKSSGLQHSFFCKKGLLLAFANKETPLIGKGMAGKVVYCQNKEGDFFAAKIAKLDLLYAGQLWHSWGILEKLGYLQLAFINNEKSYTIMKHLEGINLAYYLNKKRFFLSEKDIYQIALKMAYAVKYVHDFEIMHGDVKEKNLIISSDITGGKISLVDFDAAKDLGAPLPQEVKKVIGSCTPGYFAPEIKKGGFSQAADIYSLGCIFSKLEEKFKVPFAFIANKMKNEGQPSQRPKIKDIIHVLQQQQDASIRKSLQRIIAVCTLLALLLISFKVNFVLLTIFIMTPAYLAMKNWLKKHAFEKQLAIPKEPYQIDLNKLNALKKELNQFAIFKEGYTAQRKSYIEHFYSWFKARNYSQLYYAGVRYHELNPQDEFEEVSSPNKYKN